MTVNCRVYPAPEALVDDLRHIPGAAILFYGFPDDFNDWIIAYDAYSRNVPLATFDKVLQNKCRKLGIQVVEM